MLSGIGSADSPVRIVRLRSWKTQGLSSLMLSPINLSRRSFALPNPLQGRSPNVVENTQPPSLNRGSDLRSATVSPASGSE
jgi:hypothetical protein